MGMLWAVINALQGENGASAIVYPSNTLRKPHGLSVMLESEQTIYHLELRENNGEPSWKILGKDELKSSVT